MGMLSADDFLPFKTVFEQSDIFLQLDQIRAKAGEVLAGGDKKAEGGVPVEWILCAVYHCMFKKN